VKRIIIITIVTLLLSLSIFTGTVTAHNAETPPEGWIGILLDKMDDLLNTQLHDSICLETVSGHVNSLETVDVISEQTYTSVRHVSLTLYLDALNFTTLEDNAAADQVTIYIELPGLAQGEIAHRIIASQGYIDWLLPGQMPGLEPENNWVIGKNIEFDAIAWRVELSKPAPLTGVQSPTEVSCSATVTYNDDN